MSDGMSDHMDGSKINAYHREQPAQGEPTGEVLYQWHDHSICEAASPSGMSANQFRASHPEMSFKRGGVGTVDEWRDSEVEQYAAQQNRELREERDALKSDLEYSRRLVHEWEEKAERAEAQLAEARGKALDEAAVIASQHSKEMCVCSGGYGNCGMQIVAALLARKEPR